MGEKVKAFIGNKIFLAILSIVIGVILIVRQKAAVDSLVWLIGIVLLVCAAVFLIMFLAQAEKQASKLVISILCFVFGLIFTIKPGLIVTAFPFIMGIVLVVSGVMDLWHSMTSPKGTQNKALLIVFSLVVIFIGVLAVLQPGFIANAVILFIGIFLLINGVFDLILMIFIKDEQAPKQEQTK